MTVEELLAVAPFSLDRAAKEQALLAALVELQEHHRARCPEYARILGVMHPALAPARSLAELPWLPAALFKSHRLASVPEAEVFRTLTSSGTTGQVPSRVLLDRRTAELQSRALVRIMTQLLGPERRPMLIVDSPALLSDRQRFSARGAGVLGMMSFGRAHTYALTAEMELDRPAIDRFLEKHGNAPFLVFGFTFMVWAHLLEPLRGAGLDLSRGILLHAGGWKKLIERAVSAEEFRRAFAAELRLEQIHAFYGMVEQVGSVFVERACGWLHAPAFADVLVRDPASGRVQPAGEPGVLELLSALPWSYPGHALLTEDLGLAHGSDEVPGCPWRGTHFKVLGRVPSAELRGCSDTYAAERAA